MDEESEEYWFSYYEFESIFLGVNKKNIDDAIYLSDRIAIMGNNPGNLKEIIDVSIARPRDITSSEADSIKKRIFELFDIS